MDIKEEILELVKEVNPANPLAFVHSIVQQYSCEKLNKYITECKDCSICSGPKSLCAGNPNASVMIIGDCVSASDQSDLFVHPFDEKALRILNKIFDDFHVNHDELFFINSVNCFPYKQINQEIIKRSPTKAEVECCTPFLKYAIEIVKPRVIITLGSVALNVFKKDSITKARGEWFAYNNISIMPTFHPNYFYEIQGKKDEKEIDSLKWDFYNDIKRAFLYIQENWPDNNVLFEKIEN